MFLLVNNVVQKMHRRVNNTISLYKLTNVFLLFICLKYFLSLMYNKNIFEKTLVNLYKDIVLVNRLRISVRRCLQTTT